jgi:hypothetical protein
LIQALYDRYCSHVAWLDRDQFLFDTEMNWVAFIHNKQVWSKETLHWLGPINGVICMDKEGKVLAWGTGQKLMGDLSLHRKPKIIPRLPEVPAPILRPLLQTPPIPGTPLAGWSDISFDEWLKG